MKHFNLLLLTLLLTPNAFAAIGHAPAPVDGPAVFITKDAQVEGRRCEIKGVVMHTNGAPHVNEVSHRLVIELRKPRGMYYECPASVAMNLDSRGEAMTLYQLVKSAKKVICQSSSTISGSHVNMVCDGSFEVRSEI